MDAKAARAGIGLLEVEHLFEKRQTQLILGMLRGTQRFPLMACAFYTTYVGGSLYGQCAISFVGFEAPRVIEGTPPWESSSFRSLPRCSSALAVEPEWG